MGMTPHLASIGRDCRRKKLGSDPNFHRDFQFFLKSPAVTIESFAGSKWFHVAMRICDEIDRSDVLPFVGRLGAQHRNLGRGGSRE